MKDPHTHSPYDLLLPHGQMRDFLAARAGIAFDLPKTIRTGCDRRRPMASTSLVPASVTCLACREYAGAHYAEQARLARDLVVWMERDPGGFADARVTPGELVDQAAKDEALAAAFGFDQEAGG